jgi:hypothetical protein
VEDLDEPDEADRLLGGVDEEGINKQQTGVKRWRLGGAVAGDWS